MNWLREGPISFAHPWLLLLLLLVPVLAFLRGARGAAPAVIFSSLRPLHALGKPRRARAGGWSSGLLHAALALFIIALARPQQGKTRSHVEASGIDIMLVMDVSSSMIAEDFTVGGERVNRLVALKNVAEQFIEARRNDRIGITAFAAHPYLISPLTLDHDWLLKNLERVRMAQYEDRQIEDGTAIGSAIASAANRLKNREAKSRILILLTDGENNAGRITPTDAAEAANVLQIKIYTVAMGTRGFAPVPGWDPFGRKVYQQQEVRVDEPTLKKIAEMGQGKFFRATDSRSLKQIFDEIDKLEKSTIELTQYRQYRDLFPWLLGAGFGLLALQLIFGEALARRLP
ncbi:MAG: von Willebrand factor type [Chthoniobacter sp.]|jgi:Ca-activated chloride channel family protein|nr:von Willebrand factor type [Chthoniobacter sp.]